VLRDNVSSSPLIRDMQFQTRFSIMNENWPISRH